MEDTVEESADPNRLLPCPYDKSHKIMARRFPSHLVKCRMNHPGIAAKLATCPFNARHLVPRDEFRKHIANCVDKTCIEDFVVNFTSDHTQDRRSENAWKFPPCEEDWNKESLDHPSPPFVWGKITSCSNNSPERKRILELKSKLVSSQNLNQSLPHVLPWKMHRKGNDE